ncbi:Cytochrome P450 71A9 [Morus notabilis]|uniref:Cytochrome P450 71A9 n=2 Tax=Morus notabilis TaxID=981085 RepID=W9RV63_9ROSA|nr:Cytochrome P450 71A9 [Morus notabilis]
MFLQLGSIPTLVICSADSAKEIFKTHDVVFSGRPVLYAAKKFSYNCASVSFAPYGEYWREIRKIMILELLSAKRVKTFQAVRDEEVAVLLQIVARNSSVNLSELALSFSNNIICRVAFGKKFENGNTRFLEMLHETQGLLGGFCMADFFPWLGWLNKLNGLEMRLEKCFRELDNFYDKVIEEHLDPKRPKAEHEDVVDVLLQVQRDPSQAITINNDQIKGVLTDIFIAGSDTTATALVWIMADLIKNPSVMKRAQEEVREVSKGKGKVLERDLSKLNYLKLVIKEGLRLHPPAPLLVPRETTQSCIIEGCQVPPKTRVFVNAKVIGRDPKYWEDPNEFRPERFLDSSVDFKGQNYFELLPFGAGRRGCPGINFGVVLIELALANLLCRFDWQLPHGVKREDLDMEEAFGLTMHKKIPLCLDATIVDL